MSGLTQPEVLETPPMRAVHRKFRLGGHLRASEGLRYVVTDARAMGYQLVQIMLGQERDYAPFESNSRDVGEYRKMMYGIETYVHLPYIINPCENVPQRKGFYKKVYKDFCAAAAMLGAKAVVIHPGFKKELGEAQAYENLLKFFESTYEEDWNLDILLETDAGSKNGSKIGSVEFISAALGDLDHPRIAMCLDTTHMYARGVDLWNRENREHLLNEHGHRIRLVHLNSPDPDCHLGSFRDRHSTPFEDHVDWDHKPFLKDFTDRYPCVLERASLSVQEQDAKFIRATLSLPLEEKT